MTRNAVFSELVYSLNDTATSLATGLLLLYAAGLMRTDALTIGDLALFVSYLSIGGGQIGEIVGWVGRLMQTFRQGNVSMARLAELVSPSDQGQLLNTAPPHLRDADVIRSQHGPTNAETGAATRTAREWTDFSPRRFCAGH